eukprot:1175460-Prorocentrum_minimum.AAC.2
MQYSATLPVPQTGHRLPFGHVVDGLHLGAGGAAEVRKGVPQGGHRLSQLRRQLRPGPSDEGRGQCGAVPRPFLALGLLGARVPWLSARVPWIGAKVPWLGDRQIIRGLHVRNKRKNKGGNNPNRREMNEPRENTRVPRLNARGGIGAPAGCA